MGLKWQNPAHFPQYFYSTPISASELIINWLKNTRPGIPSLPFVDVVVVVVVLKLLKGFMYGQFTLSWTPNSGK